MSAREDPADLEGLKAALKAGAPRPDPEARDAHLRLAGENFARLHGAAPRPAAGFWQRFGQGRGRGRGLAAAGAVLAMALVLVAPFGQEMLTRTGPGLSREVPAVVEARDEAAADAPAMQAAPAPAAAPRMLSPAAIGEAEAVQAKDLAAIGAVLDAGRLPDPAAVDPAAMLSALVAGGVIGDPAEGAALAVVGLPAPWDAARFLLWIEVRESGEAARVRFDPARVVEARRLDAGGAAVEIGIWVALDAAEGLVVEVVPVAPGGGSVGLISAAAGQIALPGGITMAGEEAALAGLVVGFGLLLRGAPVLPGWGWDEAVAAAEAEFGRAPEATRADLVRLMRLAREIGAR